MVNTPLQQFYKALLPKLWNDFIFFIPKIELPAEIKKELEFLREYDLVNKPIILDIGIGPYVYEIKHNIKVISKWSDLERNVFLLLEKRANTESYEFNYILEKYFEQSSCLFFLTDWLYKNVEQIEQVDNNISGLFMIQFTNYKKHFEEMVRHFYPNKNQMPFDRFNVNQLIKDYLPDISKRFHKEEVPLLAEINMQKLNALPPLIYPPVEKKQSNKKKRKKVLITEEEAKKVILESIFKIKEY